MTLPTHTIARSPGHASEHAAAALVTATGTRASHCGMVLDGLRAAPGSTACELSHALDIDPVEVRRRLVDLRGTGEAYSGLDRRCGHPECRVATLTWYAADEARQGALPL